MAAEASFSEITTFIAVTIHTGIPGSTYASSPQHSPLPSIPSTSSLDVVSEINETTRVITSLLIDAATTSASSVSPVTGASSSFKSPITSPSTSPISIAYPSQILSTNSSTGLGSSAKIGIGLGVPLGLLILVILGFLILRHRRHRARSRSKHHGNIAAAGQYPAIDEGEREQKSKSGYTSKVENIDNFKNVEDTVHEIHGTEVPAYVRELQGSPGVRRHELPTRRGSA